MIAQRGPGLRTLPGNTTSVWYTSCGWKLQFLQHTHPWKKEYLVNILIMPERHFHFHSVVAARVQDHPVTCLQLRRESESAGYSLL